MLKNKFKIEYLLYLFILMCPILDASSCLIGNYFNFKISPTLIIRPIIPLILLLYIFIKEKKYRIKLILSGLIFIIYSIIHLYITKNLLFGISYGTLKEEATYLINYSYNIYLLFIIYYFYKNNKFTDRHKYLIIMLIEYLAIIYFSIITKTSFTTYVEGMGYRSYFLSGNSISTILILLFSITLNVIDEKKIKEKIKYLFIFLLLGIYLLFLVGTRTGLLGFIIIIVIYIILNLINYFINNKKINKKLIIISILIFIVLFIFMGIFGSQTIKRRKHIKEESNLIIDINTNKKGYTTGDTAKFVYEIKHDKIDEEYMPKVVQKTYLDLYKFSNKHKVPANNNRLQQLIYQTYLIKNQKNILYILFGNSRSVHYGEMIMEMEIPAIIYNFGIFGFLLFIFPFIYMIVKILKNNYKFSISSSMNLLGLLLAFGLSFMAGYVLFSSTCALLIIIMITNLSKEW